MTTKQPQPFPVERVPSLVLQHQNEQIFVLGWQQYYHSPIRVLHDDGIDTDFDLCEDNDCPIVSHVRIHDGVPVQAVVDALAGASRAVFGYQCYYDAASEPMVKFRRVGGTDVTMQASNELFVIDYGWEDGCWFFANPWMLEEVVEIAQKVGVPVLHCEAERNTGLPTAVAVHASRHEPVLKALDQRQIRYHCLNFRPEDYDAWRLTDADGDGDGDGEAN